MLIISYNVNGIRSAIDKGLLEWLSEEKPDIFCCQEVKAEEHQIGLLPFQALGYQHIHIFSAQKKGYSGVAVFSKIAPKNVIRGMGIDDHDAEGRVLRVDFENFTLLNCYFPSGTLGDERQSYKYRFLDDFFKYIENLKKSKSNILICGDFNICPQPIDIHNPISNKNSSGFLPEERAWVASFLESGFTDTFRVFHPEPHRYSWWSYRAGARKKNLGWRIDYFLASNSLMSFVKDADILENVAYSDHSPITLHLL
ncbi:MAG: exodeoxyribonuclease III [Flammeovirgaceae bacterium]